MKNAMHLVLSGSVRVREASLKFDVLKRILHGCTSTIKCWKKVDTSVQLGYFTNIFNIVHGIQLVNYIRALDDKSFLTGKMYQVPHDLVNIILSGTHKHLYMLIKGFFNFKLAANNFLTQSMHILEKRND